MFDAIPIELLAGAVGLTIAGIIYTAMTGVDERASIRDSLRTLEDYEVDDVRDQELLAPISERLSAPVVDFVGRMGSRFNPPELVESIRKKHLQAGIYDVNKVERFLAFRVLGLLFIPVWIAIMVLWNPFNLSGFSFIGVTALGAAIGYLGPTASLNKKVEARQKAIRQSLPDVMDLLVISVEAGLGFEQALDRVIKNVPGPLSDEFSRMLGESRAGSSRADALRAMDERCGMEEVRSFTLAMIQADQFGVSIGRVLRSQADELRVKRRQAAQEKAQQAPVKMMIPMVFCIFPALFVVVLGPAIISIMENFS